jgi:hypothetical protein
MSISGIGAGNSPAVQSMINLQNQLDQLSQELGTNQKSSTYAGLGSQSGVTVGLDAQLAAINGYGNAITDVGTRLTIAQTALQQIAAGGTTVLDSINQGAVSRSTIPDKPRFRRAPPHSLIRFSRHSTLNPGINIYFPALP